MKTYAGTAISLVAALLSTIFLVIDATEEGSKAKAKDKDQVEPMAKVMDMLNDLKLKVVNEEKEAYILYSQYNALCDKKYKATTWLVETDNEHIQELTAEMDAEFAEISAMVAQVEELVTTIAQSNLQLKNLTNIRESERYLHQKDQAELSDMIRMLERAIEIVETPELTGGASMIQIPRAASIAKVFAAMVHAEQFSSADASKLTAMIQMTQQGKDNDKDDDDDSQDPTLGAPSEVYQQQSQDVLEVMKDTLDKARTQHKEMAAAEVKAEFQYKKMSQQLTQTLTRSKELLRTISGEKSEAEKKGAQYEGDLGQYRKKLTIDEKTRKLSDQECKDNAAAFRAESKVREEEITAILRAIKTLEDATGLKRITTTAAPGAFLETTTAMPTVSGCAATKYGCCQDEVTPKDDEAGVNCGAASFKQMSKMVSALQEVSFFQMNRKANRELKHRAARIKSLNEKVSSIVSNLEETSFLQASSKVSMNNKAAMNSKALLNHKAATAAMEGLHKVVHYLQKIGHKEKSKSLAQLAMRIAQVGTYAPIEDLNEEFSTNTQTFKKVKNLIMDMIEKLEDEAAAEKDEHEYCDEEMAKAAEAIKEKKRLRDEAEQKYNAALAALARAKREIVEIGKSLVLSNNQSAAEIDMREKTHALYLKEKEENLRAKAGIEEAMKILHDYYGNDEATTENDAYTSIIKLMELILTDIIKTLDVLEAEEAQEAADAKKMEQQHELDKVQYAQDQKHRETKIPQYEQLVAETKEDYEAAQAALDQVYKIWDALKERCTFKVDGFEERIAKMERELEGLNNALAILKEASGDSTEALIQIGTQHSRSLRGLLRH